MAELAPDKCTQQLAIKVNQTSSRNNSIKMCWNQILGKFSDLITTILILIIFIAMSTIKMLVSKNFKLSHLFNRTTNHLLQV